YQYRLSAMGLQRAAEQGVPLDAIRAFLRRTSGDNVPDAIYRLLDGWEQTGGADVWLERAVILRSNAPDVLQTILETPELRRFLGAQLGPNAVIVRADQAEALAAALQQHGILVDSDA
ncbi:MAG: helicase-associated domain-containing protein, partial [Chloroflexota bacterium]